MEISLHQLKIFFAVPRSVVDTEIRSGILKARRVGDLDVGYFMSIVYHRDKKLSIAARAFLEVLRQQSVRLRLPFLPRRDQKARSRLIV
jgi:hypothetical protein